MGILKRIINFYIHSSIHVALAVYALVRLTEYMFALEYDKPMSYFAFFGTIVGYNFVKYDALARTGKKSVGNEIKTIAVLSFCSIVICGWFFLQLQLVTQIASMIFLGLTSLYTLPFFPNRRNARNWAGVKIYIVALCWVGVTVILPLLNAGVELSADFYLKCIQRFILVFVLILIFEIIDLAKDDPHLKTVPQEIGVKRTKILGLVLLLIFYCLEFLRSSYELTQLAVNFILVAVTAAFLISANEKRSIYYTSFWVESIPVLWWLMLVAGERI